MLKKTVIIFFIIAFCVAVYYPMNFFLKREKNSAHQATTDENGLEEPVTAYNEQKTPIESFENSSSTKEDDETETSTDDELLPIKTDSSLEDFSLYIDITLTDCTNECESYEDDNKKLEYCQNVCGLSSIEDINDCEKLEKLERDYCIKNKAIVDKDFKLCEEITDAKIKETCQHRIQEDFFEENF